MTNHSPEPAETAPQPNTAKFKANFRRSVEATPNDTEETVEIVEAKQRLADSQSVIVDSCTVDTQLTWSDEGPSDFPEGALDEYKAALLGYTAQKTLEDGTSEDNSVITATLLEQQTDLQTAIALKFYDEKELKQSKLRYGAVALGAAALGSINSVREAGGQEFLIGVGTLAAGAGTGIAGSTIAQKNKKVVGENRKLNIQDRVSSELMELGFADNVKANPNTVKLAIKDWHNQTTTSITRVARKVSRGSDKRAMTQGILTDIEQSGDNAAKMNELRIRLARDLLFIEMDGTTEQAKKNEKQHRVARSLGAAALGISIAWFGIPHTPIGQDEPRKDDSPSKIIHEQPQDLEDGFLDNQGLNP